MSSSPVPTPRRSIFEDDDYEEVLADSSLEEAPREPVRDCRELFDEVCQEHDDEVLQVKKPLRTYQVQKRKPQQNAILNLRERDHPLFADDDEVNDDIVDDHNEHNDYDDDDDDLHPNESEHDDGDHDSSDCDTTVKRRQPKRTAKKPATTLATSKQKQTRQAKKAPSKPVTKTKVKRTKKKLSLVDAVHKAYLEAISSGKLPDFSMFENEELNIVPETSPTTPKAATKRKNNNKKNAAASSASDNAPQSSATADQWNFSRRSITATSTPLSDITNSRSSRYRRR